MNDAADRMDYIFVEVAAGLYRLASMLLGEGEDSIQLVEAAIAGAEVATGSDLEAARKSSTMSLCEAALGVLARRDGAGLAAPHGLEHAATCIGDDELDAAGVSSEELELMISGPARNRMRVWLESLPTAMRTIFVLRAVGGFSAAETGDLLRLHGGPEAGSWSADAVRELFRQGLCSLASQVLQAANH